MCLLAISAVALSINVSHAETTDDSSSNLNNPNLSDEMKLITKSLDDLLGELAVIKQEANGRLSNVKNRHSSASSDPEQIRQVKVSRFVLRRVVELESESLSMRDELNKLFKLRFKQNPQPKQEDFDFDDQPVQSSTATITTTATSTSAQNKPQGMPTQTTLKPSEQEEAAKIGFDVEALKKLGEEIGKRLDQFGKDAAKNLNDLLEGVKLVFREPGSGKAAVAVAGGSQEQQKRLNDTTFAAAAVETKLAMI